MKQFFICFMLTILFYLGGAIIGHNFNPMEWSNYEATTIWFFLIVCIWLAPIMLNYLNGEKNFE